MHTIWHDIYQQYILRHHNTLKRITAPLKEILGISFFGYHTIDQENRYASLANLPSWCEHYCENRLFTVDPFLHFPKEEGVSIGMLHHRAAVPNGIYLIENRGATAHFAFFANAQADQSFCNSLLQNLPLLKSYMRYFQLEALHLLKGQAFSLPIYSTPTLPKPLPLERRLKFLSTIGEKNAIGTFHSLTPRELDCLKALLERKTAKETAYALSLSFRTVEGYLNRIQNKLDCSSKQELIAKALHFASLGILA